MEVASSDGLARPSAVAAAAAEVTADKLCGEFSVDEVGRWVAYFSATVESGGVFRAGTGL